MSFSSDIKEHISKAKHVCKGCVLAELSAFLYFSGNGADNGFYLGSSLPFVEDRLRYDLRKGFYRQPLDEVIPQIPLPADAAERRCCKDAFIRAAFLSCGYISDPQKSWHLEFDTRSLENAQFLQEILEKRGVSSKLSERKERFLVYIKDCDSIADVLALIGADTESFALFEIQIERRMRNDINRRINFESANLNKSAKAAIRHINAVRKIKDAGEWEKLPEVLKEIGELRAQHPEVSLKELGEMLSPPIGKSGVNHRLNRLLEIAGED